MQIAEEGVLHPGKGEGGNRSGNANVDANVAARQLVFKFSRPLAAGCKQRGCIAIGIVFDNLKPLLNPDGVLFGCTLLNKGVKKNRFSQWTMNRLNKSNVFANLEDDLEDLREELSKRFQRNSVQVIGCMALFWARK